MKIVSDNDPGAIEERKHQENLDRAASMVRHQLRRVAANILRISAGAGKAHDLFREIQALADAEAHYRELAGMGTWDAEISNALNADLTMHENRPWIREAGRQDAIGAAEKDLMRAAMRMQAAYLLDQMTQQSAAEHQMHRAIWNLGYSRNANI